MAEISPFRAVRYDARRVALKDVLTQPYDKISAEMQERYYEASPLNLIRIEKGKERDGDSAVENVYTRAAGKLDEWLARGILIQDSQPAIYAYSQNYSLAQERQQFERRGFIALGKLADYSEGVVYRHERTMTGPKADRLELLRQTRCQTGQLFLLYEDSSRRVDALLDEAAKEEPLAQLEDEYGVQHRLWAISSAEKIREITDAITSQKLVIADGHHRYETALAYRDECRARAGQIVPDAPYEKAMWTCFNICPGGPSEKPNGGLTILATHRLIRNVPGFPMEVFLKKASRHFDSQAYPFADGEREPVLAEFRRELETRGRSGHAMGVYAGKSELYLLTLRNGVRLERLLPDLSAAQRQLDVVLLHRLLLQDCLGITQEQMATERNIGYEREMDAAIRAVEQRQAQMAFLLDSVRVKQVMEIAVGGDVMPQKSTDFYPKLLSGICMYRM